MSEQTTSRAAARLSAADWVQAGFELLAEDGISALKIDWLSGRLGVTKGSFYWHFADLQAFHDAMAASWAAKRDEARAYFASIGTEDPRARLTLMMEALTERGQWTLERAVREWARSNPRVAEQVRASDRWIFRAVRQAFLDAGFNRADADMRARALHFTGVGYIHVGDPKPSARLSRERERLLDLLMTPADV